MDARLSELTDYSRWLLQRPAETEVPAYSIAIDINCPTCQPSIANDLASYLNEFGDIPSLSWKAFDSSLLDRLLESPLASQLGQNHDQFALSVAKKGGSILEDPGIVCITADLPHTFQVCLACKEPEKKPFHLHLNQKRFEPGRIVAVIADSFLEWVAGGGDPSPLAALEKFQDLPVKPAKSSLN